MTHDVKTIDGLKKFCKELRNFQLGEVLEKKTKAINKFFVDEGLDSAVVGLSGGVDSALVVKLLIHASSKPGSPIKHIIGAFMPIYSIGITGQDTAKLYVDHLNNSIKRYKQVYKSADYEAITIDLSDASRSYRTVINKKSSPWLNGQIDSIVRTPALYGLAARLQTEGFKSIVVGTTNRDEGAYIGFFGKASDGMVDLQPIADLHKSEVNELSRILGVPKEIIERPPMGDVHDGQVDEDMFGAPYWFLEMYQILLENKASYMINKVEDCDDIFKWVMNIEIQHTKNRHKYRVGSPSRYIDVMKRKIF